MSDISNKLWAPSNDVKNNAAVTRFRSAVNQRHGTSLNDYSALYQWSIEKPAAFWDAFFDWSNVIADKGTGPIIRDREKMPGAQWFPETRLNFAENLLRRRDDAPAIIYQLENGTGGSISFQQLHDEVSRLTQALQKAGIVKGDRVAGYIANTAEAIIAMLATSALGAIWSSCSPDFGVNGVLDRFGQIEPRILFATNGYHYNGKRHDCLPKIAQISKGLPTLELTIILPYGDEGLAPSDLPQSRIYSDFTAPFSPAEIRFERFEFNHPLYIMYSSGTTGVPKCIVHGAGGTLLQHLKEHQLHCDVKPGERIFYFTTCGWMMWNWLVTALASEACVMLYDGSPFHPDGNRLFDYVAQAQIHLFGVSAKFIDAAAKAGLQPAKTHDLSSLRMICSTGSPLVPEAFDYVYADVAKDVCLASISGGTDIISCFALGNSVLPVYRGELQCRGLGMKVEVWNEEGQPVSCEKGELVCTDPFPSMPLGFWKDLDGSKYHQAYFARFDNVWCHGDYVELTEQDGMIIYGRSDTVLNPGGVRIGTAEIYRQVERLDEIVESLVIGQEWQDDVRVVLFVKLREGVSLDADLEDRIRQTIRKNATPRHVPARIVAVTDIPRTKSGKIVELAVRHIVHGREVKNTQALANPESLAQYANRRELLV